MTERSADNTPSLRDEDRVTRSASFSDNGESRPGAARPSSPRTWEDESLRPAALSPRRAAETQGVDVPQLAVPLSRRYVNLLNLTICEFGDSSELLIDDHSSIPPSQIGASFWTTKEKSVFFQTLASSGPAQVSRLSRAVRTKTESEVKVYLQLLQDGVVELKSITNAIGATSDDLIPAALEVSEECEDELTAVANRLQWRENKREMTAEQKRHGDRWRIDDSLADYWHAIYEEEQSSAETQTARTSQKDGTGDADTINPTVSNGNATTSVEPSTSAETATLKTKPDLSPSQQLLQASSFIRLSQALFMNGPPGSGLNWHDLHSPDPDSSGPGISHDAFDEFYQIALSITRRLVQTSLFQAMTRLRASDTGRKDWKPTLCVKAVDVRTACDVLDLRPDWSSYWAKVATRCQVDVYSDSKKYHDGRPGTKTGHKLTPTEVAEEMGHPAPQPYISEDDGEHDQWTDTSMSRDEDSARSPSEWHSTDDSHSGNSPGIEQESSNVDDEGSDDSEETSENDSDNSESGGKTSDVDEDDDGPDADDDDDDDDDDLIDMQSYVMLSTGHASAYDDYLEQIDRKTSIIDERRLWTEILGRNPPPTLSSPNETLPPRQIPSKEDAFRPSEGRIMGDIRLEREPVQQPLSDGLFDRMERRATINRKRRTISLPERVKRMKTDESHVDEEQERSSAGTMLDDEP